MKGLQVAQPPSMSERQELESSLDEALVQSTPGLRNKTGMRKPSAKPSSKIVSRRMSSVEISLQQSVKDPLDQSESKKDKSSKAEINETTAGPPIEVGPPSMQEEPVADRPTTGSSSRRRMSTMGAPLPSLQLPTASQSAPTDVYDALVSAARDASANKSSKKSLRSVANSLKVAGKYGG